MSSWCFACMQWSEILSSLMQKNVCRMHLSDGTKEAWKDELTVIINPLDWLDWISYIELHNTGEFCILNVSPYDFPSINILNIRESHQLIHLLIDEIFALRALSKLVSHHS